MEYMTHLAINKESGTVVMVYTDQSGDMTASALTTALLTDGQKISTARTPISDQIVPLIAMLGGFTILALVMGLYTTSRAASASSRMAVVCRVATLLACLMAAAANGPWTYMPTWILAVATPPGMYGIVRGITASPGLARLDAGGADGRLRRRLPGRRLAQGLSRSTPPRVSRSSPAPPSPDPLAAKPRADKQHHTCETLRGSGPLPVNGPKAPACCNSPPGSQGFPGTHGRTRDLANCTHSVPGQGLGVSATNQALGHSPESAPHFHNATRLKARTWSPPPGGGRSSSASSGMPFPSTRRLQTSSSIPPGD